MNQKDEILTVPEVAQFLKMSNAKIYYLVAKRKIPQIKVDRNVRIRLSELEKWLETRRLSLRAESKENIIPFIHACAGRWWWFL